MDASQHKIDIIKRKYDRLTKSAIFRIEKKYKDKMQKEIANIDKPKKINLSAKYLTLLQEYARMRDAGNNGYGNCISCNARIHRKDGNGGHYISRAKKSVAYNLKNINLQCVHCNKYLYGNPEGYRKGMIAKYGIEETEKIEMMAKLTGSGKLLYLEAAIENIKMMIKEEAKRFL